MSTQETQVKNPNLVEFDREYEYFDENLNLQTKKVPVKFEVIAPVYPENATPEQKSTIDAQVNQKAIAKMNELGKWQEAVNFLIRREALTAAKVAAGVSGGINRAVLMEFIKPYRELPQFASMITASDKRKATAEEWNKQTSAILEQIKNVPFIMQAIKDKSAVANAEEE